jgi:PRTRC genetic system protein B
MSYRTAISVPKGGASEAELKIEPQAALLVSHVSSVSQPIVSRHPITVRKGKPTIGRGMVVSTASVMELLASHGLKQPLHWCDDQLLAIGQDGFVWHQPPRIAPMWWIVGGKSVSLRVRWPHLVFSVTRSHGLQIFAHAGEQRPKPADLLYLPPLGNIYGDAGLCWGNIERPPFSPDARGQFEDAIYKSNFTHANARVLSAKAGAAVDDHDRQSLFDYWLRRSGRAPKAVPTDHLVALKLHVKDLL